MSPIACFRITGHDTGRKCQSSTHLALLSPTNEILRCVAHRSWVGKAWLQWMGRCSTGWGKPPRIQSLASCRWSIRQQRAFSSLTWTARSTLPSPSCPRYLQMIFPGSHSSFPISRLRSNPPTEGHMTSACIWMFPEVGAHPLSHHSPAADVVACRANDDPKNGQAATSPRRSLGLMTRRTSWTTIHSNEPSKSSTARMARLQLGEDGILLPAPTVA